MWLSGSEGQVLVFLKQQNLKFLLMSPESFAQNGEENKKHQEMWGWSDAGSPTLHSWRLKNVAWSDELGFLLRLLFLNFRSLIPPKQWWFDLSIVSVHFHPLMATVYHLLMVTSSRIMLLKLVSLAGQWIQWMSVISPESQDVNPQRWCDVVMSTWSRIPKESFQNLVESVSQNWGCF